MTTSITENALPDEDTLVFPDAWRKYLHPRRGGAPGPRVTIDKKAPAATDVLIATARANWLDQALTKPANDPVTVEHLRRTLDGEPNPTGAAALALAAVPRRDGQLGVFADAWTIRHGVAFAAVAVVKTGNIYVSAPDGALIALSIGYGSQGGSALLRRMRMLLATASEDEYAEAVAALAPVRTCCAECGAAVAYLVPTQTEWVEEACRKYRSAGQGDVLRCSLSTPEQVLLLGNGAFVGKYGSARGQWVTMVDGLGPDAAPLFVRCLEPGAPAKTVRALGSIIAQIPGDVALGTLIERLGDPNLGSSILEATNRFPVRGLRLLAAAAAAQHPKKAARARELLQRHVRTHREAAETAVADLPERSAVIVRELLSQEESLPTLLVSPPWHRQAKKKPQAELGTVPGLEPPAPTRVEWTEKELTALKTWRYPSNPNWDHAEMAASVAHAIAGEEVENADNIAVNHFIHGPIDPQNRELLRNWRPNFDNHLERKLWPILRRFESDGVSALVHNARHAGPVQANLLLLPIVDREAARLVADWLVRLKTGRWAAESWLARHGVDAALLLIPDAVGKPGRARKAAEGALRHLAKTVLPGLPELAESHYGAEAAEVIRDMLDVAPATLLPPVKAPTLPDWLEPAVLPQVLLRGGECVLPESAVRRLLEALALSTLQEPYPGLRAALESLDGPSLAEFGWQVLSAWRSVGHPAKQAWALTALGLVGDDETVTSLVPLIKAWPGLSGHHRAVAGLEVLAAIGTDHALQGLNEIAQRVKFTALKERARTKIANIAAERGLSGEQLADRLVPDLGLDADGGLWLDYGARRFRVGFDEELKPFVTDQTGARRKDLPAPNSKDDAELSAAARKQFTALKKEARAVSSDQIRRLEQALVDRRSWTAAEFNELLLVHPLLRHVVRRLLWVSECDGVRTGFRAAEDLTLADVEDAGFDLPAAATVRLAHPLTWPEGLSVWGEIFADYEILQPFPQFGRPVYELTDAERASYRLSRFAGKKVPIGKILGLTRHGWLRSSPMDNGIENCITKRLDAARYLVIDLGDGIPVGYVSLGEDFADQTLDAVYLSSEAEVYHQGHRDSGLRFADLDPLTASELLGQLTRLVD